MTVMQWMRRVTLVLLGCAGLISAVLAQDMAGAKDHPAVKRFGGSTIVGYEVRNFDAVEFAEVLVGMVDRAMLDQKQLRVLADQVARARMKGRKK